MSRPYLSIVVAVCDDEYGLTPLMERLYPVLQGLGRPFEIIFSNDGSRDNSEQILLGMAREYPGVRIIELSARFGRQMAFLAAFGRTRGEVVVTMAADLSDPPEEIPRLVAEIERGRDLVGVVRQKPRQGPLRRVLEHLLDLAAGALTGMRMTDPDGSLRAYRHNVVAAVNRCRETTTSIPVLAYSFCSNPSEIRGLCSDRGVERTVPLSNSARRAIDRIASCSVVPLRLFGRLGVATTLLGGLLTLVVLVMGILAGAVMEWSLLLFALLLFCAGIIILGIGVLGEYLGRIYQEVRQRPRFVIRCSHGFGDE